MLGFLADLGTGIFYFLARTHQSRGPDVSRAAGDYGTRLIATAGVLNLLCVLEAFQIGFAPREESPEADDADHFQTMVIFALAVSLAFALLSKQRDGERMRYFVWAFLGFMAVAIGIGWLMYPFSR